MKAMRRSTPVLILASVLAMVLLVTLVPGAATAAGQPTVSVGAPSQVAEGSEFVVRINVDQVTSLNSYQFQLSYDPTVLQIVSATTGLIGSTTVPLDTWQLIPNGTPGSVRVLGHLSGNSTVTGGGYLAELRFQVTGSMGRSSTLTFVAPGGFTNSLFSGTSAQITPVVWQDSSVRIILAEPVTVNVSAPGTVAPGGSFIVNVNVAGVANLNSWQFDLSYNKDVIQLTGAEGEAGITPGLVQGKIMPVDRWTFQPAGSPSGTVRVLGHLAVPAVAGGDGYLAQLHFNVLGGSGTSSILHVTAVGLFNNQSVTILPITTSDATVTVANPPQISTASPLATGEAGLAYSQSLAANNGVQPYTWSIQTGSLPAGLTLNPSSGAIAGTPSAASGPTTFTVKVTDNVGSSASKEFTMTILAPLSIAAPGLTGEVGLAFARTLSVTGGQGPYTWSVQSGPLPAGLTLGAPSGNITGTPSAVSAATVTVKVTDNLGGTATKEITFSIIPAPQVATASLPAGRVGTAYTQTLAVNGGAFPYTWSLQSGSLPAGLVLNVSTGAITGTPTVAGNNTITFRVADGFGNSDTKTLLIAVASPIEIATPSTLAKGEVGIAYARTLAATGGTSPYSWSIQSGNLPPGTALNPNTGVISGTPTLAGNFTFTVAATDSSGPAGAASKTFTLEVFLRGDANGDNTVNMADVTTVERVILGLAGSSTGADANQDGTVDMVDVIIVERIILGIYHP